VTSLPRDVIEQVQRSVDIAEVVRSYFPLKRAGRNLVALCPFHAEKTPSFNVNAQKQIFKCFGCGKAGDVFGFVMAMERVEFPQAVRLVAERAGVALPEASAPEAQERQALREELHRVNRWAAELFARTLADEQLGREARAYLEGRRFRPEVVKAFGLGYAPDRWDYVYQSASRDKVPVDLLEKAGLLTRRQGGGFHDLFRGRVMFPIADERGRLVGFGGRTLAPDQQPKYLNTPETPLFDKGRLLYGLAEARKAIDEEGRAIVVEGYTDCVMAHQEGISWTVATLGTALSERHVRLLRRFAEEVVLLFDGDEAGQRAAGRSAGLFLAEGVSARVLILEQGMDPFDFLVKRGRAALLEQLAAAPEAFEYLVGGAEKRYRAGGLREREAVLEELAAVAADCTEPLRRSLLAGSIAQRLGVEEAALRERVARLGRRSEPGAASPRVPAKGIAVRVERDLVQALLVQPALIERAQAEVGLEDLEDETARRALEALYGAADAGSESRLAAVTAMTGDDALAALLVDLAEEKPEDFDFAAQLEMSIAVLAERREGRLAGDLGRRAREADASGDEARGDALRQEKLAANRKEQERRRALAEGGTREVS
jgi:DNA primase